MGFESLNSYVECGEDVTCAVLDLQAISDAKLWHARFGHLNFNSSMCLQKFEMVSLLPRLGHYVICLLARRQLAQSGCISSNVSLMVVLIATRLDLLQKGMVKKRALTLKRLLLPLVV